MGFSCADGSQACPHGALVKFGSAPACNSAMMGAVFPDRALLAAATRAQHGHLRIPVGPNVQTRPRRDQVASEPCLMGEEPGGCNQPLFIIMVALKTVIYWTSRQTPDYRYHKGQSVRDMLPQSTTKGHVDGSSITSGTAKSRAG